MCRDDEHGGRRCPASTNKELRREQNRAYYVRRKAGILSGQNKHGNPHTFIFNKISLPSPESMKDLFDRKALVSQSDFYIWSKETGGLISEWDTAGEDIQNESQVLVNGIRETFDATVSSNGTVMKFVTTGVTLNAKKKNNVWNRVEDMNADIEGEIYDTDGNVLGKWHRIVFFPENDAPYADYRSLSIYPAYQSKGYGVNTIKFFDTVMKHWGVKNVEVEANVDIGGYAWAKAGYDWDIRMGERVMRGEGQIIKPTEAWIEQQELICEYLGNEAARLGNSDAEVEQLIERLKQPYDNPDYPTPYEVAMCGREHAQVKDGATVWVGRQSLLNGHWWGVRAL